VKYLVSGIHIGCRVVIFLRLSLLDLRSNLFCFIIPISKHLQPLKVDPFLLTLQRIKISNFTSSIWYSSSRIFGGSRESDHCACLTGSDRKWRQSRDRKWHHRKSRDFSPSFFPRIFPYFFPVLFSPYFFPPYISPYFIYPYFFPRTYFYIFFPYFFPYFFFCIIFP
jgi:hypothetical protein